MRRGVVCIGVYLVCLVCLVYSVYLVYLVCLVFLVSFPVQTTGQTRQTE